MSADNPNGFHYRYEKLMFDNSPLRFGSFDEAVHGDNDAKITIWRGDYSIAKVMGMAPNNDVRLADAKGIAKQRAKRQQITNLYDDLTRLEKDAVGRQYISTTSDLSLLEKAFASETNSTTVSLGSLPERVQKVIQGWLSRPYKDADGNDRTGMQVRDKLGIPGEIVTLQNDGSNVKITAPRKVYQIRLDKDAVLPGINAITPGADFESEQELHGLTRVTPFDIKSTKEAKTLGEEFPVVTPAAPAVDAAAAPAAPAADAAATPAAATDKPASN